MALICCAAGWNGATARPLDEVVANGTLIVGVYRDNSPFSFKDKGKLAGIDVEIGRRIAARLGVAVSFMEITADETADDDLRNAVWKGHYLGGGVADVMLNVPYDQVFGLRNSEAALFAPYGEEEFVLAFDPRRVGDDPPLSAFRAPKVGVELATLPDYYLSIVGGGMLRDALVHFPTPDAAAKALIAGEVGGVMARRSALEAALAAEPGRFRITRADFGAVGRSRWPLGVAVKENSRDLGYAIEQIIEQLSANGDLAAIYKSYNVTLIPPEPL